MSAQQARSTVAADHRSIHPGLPGLPWWGVVAVALAVTAVGFAFDAGSGNKELSGVFSTMYVLGCLAAVLAARQSAVFTAVIQPPLILFCTVPGAYWLFHGAAFNGLKGIAINCGYPLIERFPLMLFASVTVLVIGAVRWYLGSAATKSDGAQPALPAWLAPTAKALAAKLSALLNRNAAHIVQKRAAARRPADKSETRRRRPGDRPRRTSAAERRTSAAERRTSAAERRASATERRSSAGERRSAGTRRTTTGSAATDSRHIRPQFDEEPRDEPLRRRPRPPQEPGRRGQPGQASRVRRDPHARTGRPTARTNRAAERSAEPPRRRSSAPTPGRNNGSTHHPVSRVRYRGSDADDRDADYPRERRRPPQPRDTGADDWQYDI